MTEDEWLVCGAPEPLLDYLATGGSQRKFRLYAVACCRSIWHLLEGEPARCAVEVSERFADGNATNSERRAAALLSAEGQHGTHYWAEAAAAGAVGTLQPRLLRLVLQHATHGVGDAVAPRVPGQALTADQSAVRAQMTRAECANQAVLLRDIFGNPFRPVAFSTNWRTDTAVTLAAQMYELRDFSAMPILADALQDAGCGNENILAHCRGPGSHVRGCWVVDLLTGRK